MSTTTHPLEQQITQARAHIDEGEFQEALDLLLAARKDSYDGASAEAMENLHYSIGLCCNQLERASEALPHLRKALSLSEESNSFSGQGRALEQLGTAAYNKGELRASLALYQRALSFWKRAEDSDAGQARCLRDIGSIQSDLIEDEDSEASFAEAKELFKKLEDDDGVLTCVTNVGLLRYRKGGPEGAIELYEESLKEDKIEHYLLFNNLGFLYLVIENTKDAREALIKGQKDLEERGAEDDNAALLYLNLGIVEALDDNDDKALDALTKAETLFDKFPKGRAVEIVMVANKDSKDFARFVLVEDADKSAIAKMNRATILAEQGKHKEALEHGENAIELDRNLPYTHYAMGWIHLKNKDEDQAGRYFKRASGMDPNNEIYTKALNLANPYLDKKAGRNDPCPCGSGKKFKKCHGKS